MDFWAGWCGGVAGVLVSHPLDLLRTRQVTNSLSIRETAANLCKESGGLIGLYKGVYSPCVTVGLWKAVALGVYQWCLPRDKTEPSLRQAVFASFFAGTVSAVTISPFEIVKIRAMTDTAKISREGSPFLSLLKTEFNAMQHLNSSILARNTALLCLRDGYGTVCYLVPYEYMKKFFQRQLPDSSSVLLPAIAAGAISGPLGWIFCYPIEVYRIHSVQSGPCKLGVWARVCQIHQKGGGGVAGTRIWFRGLAACSMRASLQVPATMAVFEVLRGYA